MNEEPGPLSGVRIVEAGHGRALRALGRLLRDLGATVERPHAAGAAGRLRSTDVLVYDEGAEPGLAAHGVDAGTLAAGTPELVAVRLSAYGTTGPLAGHAATDAELQGLAGLTAATGEETDPQLVHGLPLAARTAALSALLVIGAALVGRDRGAGGDHYDIAEYDGLITHLGTVLPGVVLTGRRPPRRGNRHAMAAPWNSYPCADAHVMVCTMGEPMWHRLAALIGRPDLVDDPRFRDSVGRVADVEALDAIISGWTAARPAAGVIAALRAARIPCGLIATPADVRDSALAERRGLVAGPGREPRGPAGSFTVRAVPAAPGALRERQGGLWTPIPYAAPPLRGVRVLELGSYTAGPAAGRLLAQLGADVLKVEPPHGEGSRRLAQRLGPVGYLYFVNNAGKRSCRLDLAAAGDRATFDGLLGDADLLLTNLAADTLAGSGIAPGQVLARHDIVHCAVSGYGAGTADRSFDTVIQAESGIMHLAGAPIGRPRKTAASTADVLGAYLAAAAAVLATYQRLRTGHGGGVDVALFDAAAWLTQDAWSGEPGPPVPAAVPRLADVTEVIRHPQVLARHMLVEQRHGDTPVLITGDHLRSLRRPEPVIAVAPVDQDEPAWPEHHGTTERTPMTTEDAPRDLEDLIYEVKDGVATITINRPRVRNALRTRTYEELTAAVTAAADDGTVGVIVIRGAGDKAFSSGGDVNDQRGRTAAVGRIHLRRLLALGAAMQECGKPIIAAVRGFCVGAGHELHLMCDLTVCTSDSQFGQVGPRVGSVPMWGATEMLPRIVGEKKAREMIYLTKLYPAAEAERMGLVNEVVEPDALDDAVDAMCRRLLDASPQSLRIAKTSLNFAIDSLRPAFTAGAEMLTLMYGTEEQGEGSAAFLEKRPPDYRKFRIPAGGASDGE